RCPRKVAWRKSKNPFELPPVGPQVSPCVLQRRRVALSGRPVALATVGNWHRGLWLLLPYPPILVLSESLAIAQRPFCRDVFRIADEDWGHVNRYPLAAAPQPDADKR